MSKFQSILWLSSSIILSLGGVAFFVFLFSRNFNVYWLILSPIIFTFYQIPAVYVYWLWKKRR